MIWNLSQFNVNVTINPTNITLKRNGSNQYPNQTGNFTSQVIDTRTGSNFTFISWVTDAPYQFEIGRATGDGNDATDEDIFINTSGLVLLMHLNNESGEFEQEINTTILETHDISSGLVGLWHFNNESQFGEGTETTSDGDNYTVDFSVDLNSERIGEARNNGTFLNGATINKTSYKLGGGAGEFDGSDDIVTAPNIDSLEPKDAITISLWFKRNGAQPSFGKTLWYGQNAIDPFGPYGFQFKSTADDNIQFHLTTGVTKTQIETGNIINDGQWYHIAGVYDGSNMILYLDGTEVNKATKSGTIGDYDDTNGLGIGDKFETSEPFKGQIDEVAIWNRSLSADEIAEIAGSKVTSCSGIYYLRSKVTSLIWILITAIPL